MTNPHLVETVTEALDASGIPHMLVGSFGSAAFGTPRATQDIDIVIDPTPEALHRFVGGFDEDAFYIGPDPQTELRQRGQFNLVDLSSSWKVDLIMLKPVVFDRIAFERRVRTTFMGVEVWVASPEDIVLSKLRWAALSESNRQLEDAAGVLAVRGDCIDHSYLDRWAAELDIAVLLDRARQLARR